MARAGRPGFCALLGMGLALAAAAQQEEPASAPDKVAPRRRVVGSIIFPDRGHLVRESSALKIVSPEALSVVTNAMQYIRGAQQADGSWGDRQFPKSSGVTALACMALFAEGSLPRVGYSGHALDRGIGFLLSCAKEDGLIVAQDTYSYGPLYDHIWSTYVLLLAHGNAPWYPDLQPKLSRALQALLRSQKPDGGWRYTVSPLGSSDISVTASALLTLRVGRLSGFGIAEENITRAEDFIIRLGKPMKNDDAGTFAYREGGERGSASVTAAGLLGLFSRGLYTHEYVKPCTEYIAYTYRRAHLQDLRDSPRFRYFHFGCYYASQAMYMAGDEYWIPWYRKIATVLKETQAANGSFRDLHDNLVYPTAISALVLQAPFGYMPQYLR
jgi:hypothetical protein